MSKTNKSKSSLANVIKERAQRPDFLPKSFVEDSTRLAEETIPRAHEPFETRTPAPTHPSTQAPTHPRSYEPTLSSDRAPTLPHPQKMASSPAETPDLEHHAHARDHAPARPRSYAQAVLNARADNPRDTGPAARPPKISPYRRDLKKTSTYLTDAAKDQLRVLCFNERTSEEALLREAIDMLFQQRGLPTIAFQGAPSRPQRPH